MSYDSTSIIAREMLSYFGRNTAVTVRHNYGTFDLEVVSARTGNVIATILLDSCPAYESIDFGRTGDTFTVHPFNLSVVADAIMSMKRFPKNRKMNKAWSPIRFSASAKAMMEQDSGIRFN